VLRRTDIAKFAIWAVGFARRAAAAAVKDEPVAQVGPRISGKQVNEILLDADRVGEFRVRTEDIGNR
jgi:hypothetical protein